jgi:hypothetical protein
MNFYHFLKKVGQASSGDLFSIWYFLNLHALGYPKSVTFFCPHFFGLTSPSAWRAQLVVLLVHTFYFDSISKTVQKWQNKVTHSVAKDLRLAFWLGNKSLNKDFLIVIYTVLYHLRYCIFNTELETLISTIQKKIKN